MFGYSKGMKEIEKRMHLIVVWFEKAREKKNTYFYPYALIYIYIYIYIYIERITIIEKMFYF